MDFDSKENSIITVRTEELKDQHSKYLEKHPELQQLLNDFVSEVLLDKPEDPITFAREYFSKFNPNPVPNYPLAILGPAGVGRRTFLAKLFRKFPNIFEVPRMTSTSASQRDCEIISKEEFLSLIESKQLIHYVQEEDHFTGIRLSNVQSIFESDKISLLLINVDSAIRLFNERFEFNRLLIKPKNMKQLEDRLRERGVNDDNVLRVRLRAALAEIELAQKQTRIFKDFVINDQVEEAFQDLLHIIYRCYERLRPENFRKYYPQPSNNNPLVLVGPSGVGKSTLIQALMEKYPGEFEFSISSTTRLPRVGESHGVHYYFITREEFMRKIEEGEFVEHCEVHNNLYGTSRTAVRNIFEKGKICLLDIDVQGVMKLVNTGMEFNRIFVRPKDVETLEQRLRGRATDSEEVIRNRVKNASKEMNLAEKYRDIFKNVIVNDDLEAAKGDILRFVREFYPRFG
jgi:guanylate kinase